MQEGISYIAGANIPCVIVNVMRGGPGLGTIQPSQADYYQAVKGGGHGDYRLITLAPASVQEMADFMELSFDLAFHYRNPVMILSDGLIGQMMEKVVLPKQKPRLTNAEIEEKYPWATLGKPASRTKNVINSLNLLAEDQEHHNHELQAKYREIEKNEVRYEAIGCEKAEYVIVAFGSAARICQNTIEMLQDDGICVGLIRPITLYPFPYAIIEALASNGVKGMLTVEMNAGQMVDDVKIAANGKCPVKHFGRMGGMIPSPEEVFENFKTLLLEDK